jgi:GH3 auxin-responsive promoter
MALAEALASWVFTVGIETRGRSAYRNLLASADRPDVAQRKTLTRILRALATTERGRRYGFAEIEDPDDLRRRVPITDYEALRPFIDRQIGSGDLVVAPARPIMYARTSGTTGKPKLIPITPDVVTTMRRAQRAFSYVQHRDLRAFRGRVLAISGALREETLHDGTPAGSATGLIYETMPPLIRAKYVVPTEVFALEDYELRYATIARLAVQHRSLSMIATANPSTILRLLQQIEAESGQLAEDVAAGRFASLARVPEPIAARVAAALKANPTQAAVLAAASVKGTLALAELWPNLRAVMTWLGAGCAAYCHP